MATPLDNKNLPEFKPVQSITLGEALRRERIKTLVVVMDVLNSMEVDIRHLAILDANRGIHDRGVWSKLSMLKEVQKMIGEIK